MRLNIKCAAAFAALAFFLLASGAAGARTTAGQVVDDATLKAFVDGAAAEIAAITDIAEGGRLRDRFRTDGDWNSGSMFLILFTRNGNPFIHGKDRSAENKDLLGVEDDNGFRVVEALLAAGARGGDFVRYHDGEPKTAYAVEYTSGISGTRFVLVGGYSQDVSDAPLRVADLPKPTVTASEVVDRETLITFVEEAARIYSERALNTADYRDFAAVRNAFRQEGGYWKSGSVYLWIVAAGNITFFHATEPFREGRPTDLTRTDINGVMFAEELIGGARREGSKFLRYHYDDPTIEGDEDTGSPKLGYAVSIPVFDTGQKAVIGSGVYLGTSGAALDMDEVSKAWLARFGRTVADHVIDAVESRMTAPQGAGMEASLAGHRLGGGPAVAMPQVRDGDRPAPFARALTDREMLSGWSFAMTGENAEGGTGVVWGRGAVSGFDGRAGTLALDGEVTSGMLGGDFTSGRGTMGLVTAYSRGEGSYRSATGGGDIESALTGFYPWGRYVVSERFSVWGVAGYGSGTLTLMPENDAEVETDMDLAMGAFGGRGLLMKAPAEGGLDLSVKSDALLVRTSSDEVDGDEARLAASQADVARLRLGLEGVWQNVATQGGWRLRPGFEIGARLDGGDAETGLGAELGGSLALAHPSNGLLFNLKGRGLVAHRRSGFREWSSSASIGWDPSRTTDRGPSLSLTQSLGTAPWSGMDAMLTRKTLAGMAWEKDGAGFENSGRMEGRIGYGLALFGGGFTGTPNLGFGLSGGGSRDWRLGWRLTSAVPRDPGLEVSLDATRREQADGTAPEHGVLLQGTLRW